MICIFENKMVYWGRITFDQGFIYSSNTAVVNIMDKYLDANSLKSYLKRLGFGSKTGVSLPNEVSGKIDFKYETEVFNAAFGQGITTTPIQHIKALTAISNDGELLSPYIVKSIEQNGKTKEFSRNSLGRVASSETVEYMKNLMWHTINDADGAAHAYSIEGFNIIGKTGTAQIASTNGKGYLTGDDSVIRSIALMFPKDDPQIIIYGAVKKSKTVNALSEPVKEIIQNIAKYYNIYSDTKNTEDNSSRINNYINLKKDDVLKQLNDLKLNVVVIGDGDRIINQYPINSNVTKDEKIFLLTNSSNYVLPDLKGYSKSDVETLLNILKIEYQITGHGYVETQSVPPNTPISLDMKLEINLSNKIGT